MLNARLALVAGILALTLSACGSGKDDPPPAAGGTPTGSTASGGTPTGSTASGGTPTGSTASGTTTDGGGFLGGGALEGLLGGDTGATTSGSTTSGGTTGTDPGTPTGHTYFIAPGAGATAKMVEAMVAAVPGDTIEFGCGFFDLTQTLSLSHSESITIKGCGKDKTVLSFANNVTQQEGVLIDQVNGVVIQDLTVADSSGNGFELRSVNHGTLSRVRAIWSSGGGRFATNPISASNYKTRLSVGCTDPATQNPDVPEHFLGDTTSPDYTVSPKSGRYGIYPVASDGILIEDSESVGASDAGIYVGQTNNAIIRNSRSAFNVFGFEIENVNGGEYANNVAECNTGGFLIYDLDGLRQYGDRSLMHGNIARMNNTYNFTSGGFVGNVPPGSGMITLAYDRIDIFDNEFSGNNTAGIIHASYELFPPGAGRPTEKRIDFYTEGLHIYRNKFINNGKQLPLPTTTDIQNQDLARLLPTLVGLKNQVACLLPTNTLNCLLTGSTGYQGAHIIWDGLLDTNDASCPYPKNSAGANVPKDERGKPILSNDDPNPSCHYNAYKFDQTKAAKPRKVPGWWASCIDDDNEFDSGSLPFANFHGTKGLEVVVNSSLDPTDPNLILDALNNLDPAALAQFPSSFDRSAHNCVAKYGRNLDPLPPVVIPPFVPSGEFDPEPAAEVVDELCDAAVATGAVNFAAAQVSCPRLDQYHLFSDAEDPTSTPNGGGLPFSLNTKLFSDYTVKYRVAFMPPGTKAVYKDKSNGANATIVFPTGTIISKTFSVANEGAGTETPIETRLLMKRETLSGSVRWTGVAYVWKTVDGHRVATLAKNGDSAALNWNHHDVDSDELSSGTTSNYVVPNTNQCLSCHSNANKESGASPIGTKLRFMNGPYRMESTLDSGQSHHEVLGQNQIAYWCSKGYMSGCPSSIPVNAAKVATGIERSPIFNKPGDSGAAANSAADVEARARAYLEVNCQHCHNEKGFAASTGLYLDSLRKVDSTYGICKHPTATGSAGSGGRHVDLYPGQPDQSILPFRISDEATTAAARMPPIARSVVHAEGHALIQQWVRDVLVVDEDKYPGSSGCATP